MTTHVHAPEATDLRASVMALLAAFNEHDVDKLAAMHAPDAVWVDPTLEEPVVGRDAITRHASALLRSFPDLRFELDGVRVYIADDHHAASGWRWTGTMDGPIDPPGFAPTGKSAVVEGACLYEFRDGLLARHQIVFDAMGLLRQVGVMPALSSTAAKMTAGLQRTGLRVTHALHHN